MEWGIAINLRESVEEIIEKAMLAEHGRIDTIWLTDFPATRLSPILAAVVAQNTEKCRIGVGLLSPFIYSSSQIAQYIASLIELYGNRFDLLLGPGDRNRLRSIGIDYGDVSTLVKRISNATEDIREKLPAENNCRIFWGAQGPKMISSATLADGVLLNYSDLKMISWAKTLIRNKRDDFRVGVFPPALIGSPTPCSEHLGIRLSAAVVALGLSRSIMSRFDLIASLQPAISYVKKSGTIDERVVERIDQQILDRFCLCGQHDILREYIKNLDELHVHLIVFGPPQGASTKGVESLIDARKACEEGTNS